ncbi:MAG: hypothetical protein OEZ16_09805, partial [Chromatiales bacterium]|nr:hypothetical protein [Chromatiales bacterium]
PCPAKRISASAYLYSLADPASLFSEILTHIRADQYRGLFKSLNHTPQKRPSCGGPFFVWRAREDSNL